MAEPALAVRVTIGEALRQAAATLTASSETPRLDAELLLAEVLASDRARLVLDFDRLLDPTVAAAFAELIARRAAHEPVAYILGRRGFRWLTLAVDPRVLIPRPESELLVELALTLPEGAHVLDVGAGSGAIALAVKHERPDLVVRGIDISAGAMAVARANAAMLDLDVSFTVGDLTGGVAAGGRVADAVLANLPYVPEGAVLPDDVADFEPATALRAGCDGLDLIRRLVGEIAALAPASRPDLLALELGPEQAPTVAALVGDAGYPQVRTVRDLAGRDRVVVGTRQ